MNFKAHIAKYITENYSTSQLPEIALYGLKENLKSESLEILASMSKLDNGFEILEYFDKAIFELNYKLPDKRTASLIYSEAIIDEIIKGEKEVLIGLSEIVNNAIRKYDFYSESVNYLYDSIGFSKVYGLYDDYTDNIDDENIKIEIIKELEPELLIWKSRIKNELCKSIE